MDGICVRGQKQKEIEVDINQRMTDKDKNGQWYRIQWLPETQHFVNEALQPNRLRDKLVHIFRLF